MSRVPRYGPNLDYSGVHFRNLYLEETSYEVGMGPGQRDSGTSSLLARLKKVELQLLPCMVALVRKLFDHWKNRLAPSDVDVYCVRLCELNRARDYLAFFADELLKGRVVLRLPQTL